jgi:hypothetical protein
MYSVDLSQVECRHHDVEQVEHIILRNCFQRPHEGEQRRHAPFQWHLRHGLSLGDRREPGKRHDASGKHVIDTSSSLPLARDSSAPLRR